MRRSGMTMGDRLGWMAYLTVMGGGVPDLRMMFADLDAEEPPDEAEVPVQPRNPLAGTVPYEMEPEKEREEIAAA